MAERSGNPSRREYGEESLKETFESVVMAFILAFVFRAYVVEAFVIPTGSMAPTLLGQHVRVNCLQCGYEFAFDVQEPDRDDHGPSRPFLASATGLDAICPMCHFPNPIGRSPRVSSGDRILVHKYIYSLTEPRRWDVVVFKNPSSPEVNYIKRLVGLPGDRLWIIDGNVYVAGNHEDDWRIARKSERHEAQMAVWQPIYHSQYVPLDKDSAVSRRVDIHGVERSWQLPWSAAHGAWSLDDRRYALPSGGSGTIRFDFDVARQGRGGWYAYNQFGTVFDEPIEDIRIAATFVPAGQGLSVEIGTKIRAHEADPQPPWSVVGKIDGDGRASLEMVNPASGRREQRLASDDRRFRLAPNRPTAVELWYVDQEASLWIGGRCALRWPFELDIEVIKQRPLPSQTPEIHISVNGPPVTLHQVEVDRDLFYSSTQTGNPSARGLGTLAKWTLADGTTRYEGEPVQLDADQFFCLGDNSPRSSDSRYWHSVHPWIVERMLKDKSQQVGVVPRNLMMGRAFFVYFPAPYLWRPSGLAVVPNFGKMRFIH